ncbi:hypothetical protein [Mycobacterium xenopi]|uniref:DUF7159 domain-containing protein n=1 Tax=Mycobacterium xenopi TaxID=1789 RepID=A0AAD1H190_MYCXE|nr:hypothetical protein [Mycobacterium xenopi]MDA3639823.1 hypothetical protein [Mycobacterium xenopi]MDA3658183.1 hypothetical protein [Mycobacterium xenopi]MDA3661835.1 hypothetical protein [Mycobacterium xenopi]ORX21445.1 hypothetical protein AWC32_23350 [Mycobacterium xenopi]SPX88917.1 putative transmembrane protein [Mycobacterium xenopi]
MDVVLGVSMAPESVRMVVVEGQNGDGVTVEEDSFDTAAGLGLATLGASEQVVAAILGTREGAAEAGHHLLATGVTWTDQAEAASLRDALAAHQVENVMLVSAFLAAAALAQTVGSAIGYEHIAMLFVEPDTATLAVVDSADGSITDVRRQSLTPGDDPGPGLLSLVAGLEALQSRPEGLFVVGSGVDVAAIKPRLEAATPLAVSAPEEPETALARGAALASANAPLFASSTAALAYAQDPGTGEVDPLAYLGFVQGSSDPSAGDGVLAYSAAGEANEAAVSADTGQRRRPVLLVGSTLATIVVGGVVALAISLAISIRPTVALRPEPAQSLIVPAQQPPPPSAAQPPAPQPEPMHQAPPVVPAAGPPPAVNPPAPPEPVPVAAPVPVAPAPQPVPVAAPVPVPIPAPMPVPAPPPAPVHITVPAAPVRLPPPQPPVQLPISASPVQAPRPPVHVPTPPVLAPAPTPPAHVPETQPPVHIPSPQPPVHVPEPQPPVRIPEPQPPVDLPSPQPPVRIPTPEPPARVPAPAPIHLPAPEPPAFPAMPAPAAPRIPTMPAPAMPAAPAVPAVPRFNVPMPAFHF